MILRRMFEKKGSAALVVVVLVLGYMMSVSMSNVTLISTEATGHGARDGYKKAHYAAMAGIGIVMARLRQDSAQTFGGSHQDRPYFILTSGEDHYIEWDNATAQGYPGGGYFYAPGWISVASPAFASDTLVLDDYSVRICSYFHYDAISNPSEPPIDHYYVKSQGRYIDFETEREHRAQVWARFIVRGAAKLIAIDAYGSMDAQPLDKIGGSGVNDFWDWQNKF